MFIKAAFGFALSCVFLKDFLFVQAAEDMVLRAPIISRRRSNINNQHRKNNADLPFTKRDVLYNEGIGTDYLVEVGIGTPPQYFVVTLDTGSNQLWVPYTKCSAKSCVFGRFNSTLSSTFKGSKKPFEIEYGIGSVKGVEGVDVVSVGNISVSELTFGLISQQKEQIFKVSGKKPGNSTAAFNESLSNSEQYSGNGVMGLCYSVGNASDKSYISNYSFPMKLYQDKTISQPIFSIYLNTVTNSSWSGEVIFGGTDESKYTGDLSYLPVTDVILEDTETKKLVNYGKFYWQVPGQGFAIRLYNNTSQQSASTTAPTTIYYQELSVGTSFILDTGTTMAYLPSAVLTSLLDLLDQVGAPFKAQNSDGSTMYYTKKCTKALKMSKNIRMELEMSLSKTDISAQPVVLSVPPREFFLPIGDDICMLGIASTEVDLGDNTFLIGDAFLRAAYMQFDFGKNVVGLAKANAVDGNVYIRNTDALNS